MALIEAMAVGLPVVATDVGGVSEAVVEGSTGLLVPPAAPEALVEAMQKLAEDGQARARFGVAGRERAERLFSLSVAARKHELLYERLLRRRGIPTAIRSCDFPQTGCS